MRGVVFLLMFAAGALWGPATSDNFPWWKKGDPVPTRQSVAIETNTVVFQGTFQFSPIQREPQPIKVILVGGGWLIAYPSQTNGVWLEVVRYNPLTVTGVPDKPR